jgi:hypothetical protein
MLPPFLPFVGWDADGNHLGIVADSHPPPQAAFAKRTFYLPPVDFAKVLLRLHRAAGWPTGVVEAGG